MDMQVFAERLKTVRTERNVSVDELAEVIKVNRTTINRYERGTIKSIKIDKLEAIANYLSVNKDYLCGETDDKYNVNSLEQLTKKQYIDVTKIVRLTTNLVKQKNVTLDGEPMSDANTDYLIDAMELALEMLKKRNKK